MTAMDLETQNARLHDRIERVLRKMHPSFGNLTEKKRQLWNQGPSMLRSALIPRTNTRQNLQEGERGRAIIESRPGLEQINCA